jgi:hypothetical protein
MPRGVKGSGPTKPGKMEREKPTKGKAGKTVKKGVKKGGPGKRGRGE